MFTIRRLIVAFGALVVATVVFTYLVLTYGRGLP